MMNWIDPNKQKPKKDQVCLVTVDRRKNGRRIPSVHEATYIGINKLNHDVWHCPWEYDFKTLWEQEVIAWCPMPEPYKVEDK